LVKADQETPAIEIRLQLRMADTRKRPGWLPCAKLAVNSEISIWFEPCKALDVFSTRAGEPSNHCAEEFAFCDRRVCLRNFKDLGNFVYDYT